MNPAAQISDIRIGDRIAEEGSGTGLKLVELPAPSGLVVSKLRIIRWNFRSVVVIDLGGALGMAITVLFVCILAAGIAYGIWASRNAPRDRVTMQRKNRATRENFSEYAVEEKPLLGDRKSR
jgi:hypothetical protein